VAAIPDEILMAYADGALDKEARARVEAVLFQDADARRRVEIFRFTGASLSEPFKPVMEEAVPLRLVNFVLDYAKRKPDPAKRLAKKPSTWISWLTPQNQAGGWQFAAASVAVLAVGAGAGWVLRGEFVPSPDRQELAALSGGQILAKGPLQQILEAAPSNREVRVGGWLQDSTVVRVDLTFRNTSGSYCREYQMAVPAAGDFTGLACRTGQGQWTIQVHTGGGGLAGTAQPAPAGRAQGVDPAKILDPVIDRIMAGDALSKTEEEAAIAKGWQ